MPSHVLYIDDSGTKEYATDPVEYENSRSGKSRYFVFGGVLATTVAAGNLRDAIVGLKKNYFGTSEIEVKSNWLRIPYERQRRYIDKYGITDDRLRLFMDDFYSVINGADILFIASVIDKKHMQDVYPQPWYAPAVAYDLILQRVRQEVHSPGDVAVVIDDMTGATPRGNQYKVNLTRQHQRLKQRGSDLRKGFDYSFLHSQKFVDSKRAHIVQVADIAAYNVYRQFIDFGDNWEDGSLKKLPTYEHLERILKKFRQGDNGRVQGYGIVKFPLLNRMQWSV
jgi:hypothetical protein